MPISCMLCGAIVGAAIFIIAVAHFAASVLACTPLAVFLYIALTVIVGAPAGLSMWGSAYREFRQDRSARNKRLERRLRELISGYPTARVVPATQQTDADEKRLRQILGDIPRFTPPRWERIRPLAEPPYPRLTDCFWRPLPRMHSR
jgi:hypothetical protein